MKNLIPFMIALMLSATGFAMVLPVLPFLMYDAGGNHFNASSIVGIFSLMSVLVAPIWGKITDKIGRKPVLLLSCFASSLAYLWLSQASSIWEIYAARILSGFAAGWMVAGMAYVSDATERSGRLNGLGLYGAAFGMGFTIGPFIAAAINNFYDAVIVTYGSFICNILAFIVILIFLPEIKAQGTKQAIKFKDVYKVKNIQGSLLTYFLIIIGFAAIESTIALWGYSLYNYGAGDIGILLGLSGVIAVIVQGYAIKKINNKIHVRLLAIIGGGLIGLGLLCMALLEHAIAPYIVIILGATGFSLAVPSILTMISLNVPEYMQGRIFGTTQAIQSLGRGGSAILFGFIFETLGIVPTYIIAFIPIILAMLVMAVMHYRQTITNDIIG